MSVPAKAHTVSVPIERLAFESNMLTTEKANAYGRALVAIQRANGGILKPELVVRAAAKRDHPLHDYFEWNDGVAAGKWRKWQARVLIGSISVIVKDNSKKIETRAFTSVGHGTNRNYVDLATTMSNSALRKEQIERALTELRLFVLRYQIIPELAPVLKAIEEVSKRFEGI